MQLLRENVYLLGRVPFYSQALTSVIAPLLRQHCTVSR